MATHPHEPGSSAAAGGSVAPNTAEQRPLAIFQLLPTDLKTFIVSMACSAPGGDRKEGDRFLPSLNPQPAKAMALVSKSFYAVGCSVLYAHIRVTRISSLKLLLDAVISRPPLGRLIKRLHIGAGDDCISRWIPITSSELTLRLWLPEDHGKWPSWVKQDRPFYQVSLLASTTAPSEAVQAIVAAIDSVCDALDLNMDRSKPSRGGHLTSMSPRRSQSAFWKLRTSLTPTQSEWYCRLFELFAATELYVLAMRRYEDEATQGSRPRYPRLIISSTFSSPAGEAGDSSTTDTLVLSRSQLVQRLAARHSQTDRFDHQLIFLRSGLESERSGLETHSWRVSKLAASRMNDEDLMDEYSAIEGQLEDPTLPSTATVGGLLGLTRALLSQTPLLQHLSLTGYLVSAVCGARAPAEFRRLRSLSLGPPPFVWSWPIPLRFDIPTIAGVERLLLSGHNLSPEQAATLVGHNGEDRGLFPNLRHFRWSCPRPLGREEPDAASWVLLDTINVLAGREAGSEGVTDGRSENSRKRARNQEIEDDATDSTSSLSVEAYLDRRDGERLLASAPTSAAREAWRTGGTPDAGYAQHRRLHLVGVPDRGALGGYGLSDLRELYDEGREWLEEGAAKGPVCC